jgi:hypothetical protein
MASVRLSIEIVPGIERNSDQVERLRDPRGLQLKKFRPSCAANTYGTMFAQLPVKLPFDNSARNDLISDDTKSAKARTRGVCCMSRCMSR